MIATTRARTSVRMAADGSHPTRRSTPSAMLAAVARIVQTIIGVPDYDRYVAHHLATHPGCELLSREAFMRDRLEARYNRPGSKCC